MGKTADKLAKLAQTKEGIKAAIEAKGYTVGNIPFSQYPGKIQQIEGGGQDPEGIDAFLDANNLGYLRNSIKRALQRSIAINNGTLTLNAAVGDNSKGGALFISNVLPPTGSVSYNKSLLNVRSVDLSGIANLSSYFRESVNLVEFGEEGKEVDLSAATTVNTLFADSKLLERIAINAPLCADFNSFASSCESLKYASINTTSANTSMNNAFQYCGNLTTVDFPNGMHFETNGSMIRSFTDCNSLVSINGIIDITNVTNIGSSFDNCDKLKDMKLKGLNASLVLRSPALSKESLLYLFNNAVYQVTTRSLYLNKAVVDQLTSDEIAIITTKGFTISN